MSRQPSHVSTQRRPPSHSQLQTNQSSLLTQSPSYSFHTKTHDSSHIMNTSIPSSPHTPSHSSSNILFVGSLPLHTQANKLLQAFQLYCPAHTATVKRGASNAGVDRCCYGFITLEIEESKLTGIMDAVMKDNNGWIVRLKGENKKDKVQIGEKKRNESHNRERERDKSIDYKDKGKYQQRDRSKKRTDKKLRDQKLAGLSSEKQSMNSRQMVTNFKDKAYKNKVQAQNFKSIEFNQQIFSSNFPQYYNFYSPQFNQHSSYYNSHQPQYQHPQSQPHLKDNFNLHYPPDSPIIPTHADLQYEYYGNKPCKIMVRQIWVGGLPQNTNKNYLEGMMSKYGLVQNLQLFPKFAFVKFKKANDAALAFQRASQISSILCSNSNLRISFSNPQRRKQIVSNHFEFEKNAQCMSILFISFPKNTSSKLTLPQILELCKEFGKVENYFYKKSLNPLFKSYLLINYTEPKSAQKAKGDLCRKKDLLGDRRCEIAVLLQEQGVTKGKDFSQTIQNFLYSEKPKAKRGQSLVKQTGKEQINNGYPQQYFQSQFMQQQFSYPIYSHLPQIPPSNYPTQMYQFQRPQNFHAPQYSQTAQAPHLPYYSQHLPYQYQQNQEYEGNYNPANLKIPTHHYPDIYKIPQDYNRETGIEPSFQILNSNNFPRKVNKKID